MENENTISYFVIIWDPNQDKLEHYDVMPYFLNCWEEEEKRGYKIWNRDFYKNKKEKEENRMPETFDEFKKFILDQSMYNFWARCEYEVIVTGWPVQKREYKLDVHEQIKMNIDIITKIFMDYIINNKIKKK